MRREIIIRKIKDVEFLLNEDKSNAFLKRKLNYLKKQLKKETENA